MPGTILLKLCAFFLLHFTTLLYGMCFHLSFTDEEVSAQGKYITLTNYHVIIKKCEVRLLLNISIYSMSF